jgi:phospholipid/cholesterol/gamma-HCH transport system substrate-binding protein
VLKLTRNDASVGAFLLVALIASMTFIVLRAQNQGWARGTKRFSIRTDDGRNIKLDAPVRMRGIQVGVVERIDLALEKIREDAEAKNVFITVTFRVEPQYAPTVRTNAVASIVEPPVLGVTFIDLDPGNPGLAEALDDTRLALGDTPLLMETVENAVLRIETILRQTDQAITRANTALAAVSRITTDIAEGEGFVSRLIKDQQISNDLKKTIGNIALMAEDATEVTGALRRREGAFGRVLKSDQIIVEAEKLLEKTRDSLSSLDAVTDRLTRSVEQVAQRLDQTGGSVEGLKDVVDNTKKITAELATLAANVNAGKGSVGKLLVDDAVYVEAKGLLKELRETVQDLREQAPINSFIGVVFSAF